MTAITLPPLIPLCCVCGLVGEEQVDELGNRSATSWCDLGSYLDRHHLQGEEYMLTETYCPSCSPRYVSARKLASKSVANGSPHRRGPWGSMVVDSAPECGDIVF
jgi:hypothetical protein